MSSDTNTTFSTSDIAAVAKPYRLQYEEAQESWVLLYPEGMVKLNGPAGEILKRCDGEKTIDAVIRELEKDFEQKGLEKDVMGFLDIALEKRWINLTTPSS